MKHLRHCEGCKLALRIAGIVWLIVLMYGLAHAQTDTCTNGDELIINTSTKRYQCLPHGVAPTGTGSSMIVANEGVTGTTVNRLAKLTGAPSTAIVTAISDTENAIGIVNAGAGTTGSATITILGQASCDFDGATTAGDYFVISAITAGMCHDAGSTFPTSGATYGRVLSTNVGAGTYVVELMTPDIAFQNAGNGKSKPGGSNLDYQFNNSNQFGGAGLKQTDANTVEQYNGTTSQQFNVYGTRSSSTNFERFNIFFNSGQNAWYFGMMPGSGGGTARPVRWCATNACGFGNNFVQFNGTALTAANDVSMSGFNGLTVVQSSTIGWSSGASMTGANSSVVFNNTYAGCIGSPSTFSAGTTNNPDFGSACLSYRLTPNSSGSTITGGRDIVNNTAGEHHEVWNVSTSGLLTLANQNTGSSAGRRWITAHNLDMNLGTNQGAYYFNDTTSTNYRIGKFATAETLNVTTQFDKTTDTTLANVTGLSIGVQASRTYNFKASLYYDADVTGGAKFAIGGTATATAIIYQINTTCNASSALVITSRQTALAGSAGQAGCTAGYTEINGTITVNAAGTLTVQFAQNASNATSSVLVGSAFYVNNIR